jgi:hypothetical protein
MLTKRYDSAFVRLSKSFICKQSCISHYKLDIPPVIGTIVRKPSQT